MFTYGIKMMTDRNRGFVLVKLVNTVEEAEFYLAMYRHKYTPIEIYYYIYEEKA